MAHRNVHFFRRQTPIIYNQVNNYNIHHCRGGFMGGMFGGSIWSNPMMLMNMLYMGKSLIGGMFGLGNDYASLNRYNNSWALDSQTPPDGTETATPDSTVKNLEKIFKGIEWIYQDGEFWGAKDGEIVARGKTFETAKAAMEAYLKPEVITDPKAEVVTAPKVEVVTAPKVEVVTDPKDENKDTYRIEKTTITDTTYTVKKGNTWWGIVSANYDTSNLSGKEIIELALRLAAANSGIENETDAYAAARKGIYFKVGDQVKLPPSLNVNGKAIARKDTPGEVASQPYSMGSGGTMMASITANSQTSYNLYINGELKGTYTSEAEAKKDIPEGAIEEAK